MAAPAASQMSMQQPYQQHAANIDSMASLNLNQPAAVPTFDAHANVCTGYEGIQMPANNNGGQVYGRNTYDAPDSTFQQNTGAQVPQGMYGAGFDSTGVASSTGAMGLNAKMMLNMNSAFIEQDTSTPTGQTSQQSLLYQQQQQYLMAMANSLGGFPGAYGNMAALYGPYSMGAGYSAGYGGMPNSMGYGGMPNAMNTANLQSYSGNSTGQGYGNSHNKQHHNRKQPNYNTGFGGYAGGNSYGNNNGTALPNFSSGDYQSANPNLNMYNNMMGNMGSDSSSQFQSSYAYAQQQQQQQHLQPQQHQPFGGSLGASSRMSNMWSN